MLQIVNISINEFKQREQNEKVACGSRNVEIKFQTSEKKISFTIKSLTKSKHISDICNDKPKTITYLLH